MVRTDTTFTTISSAGGLLPAALLARLADDPDTLPGTGPVDYGLIDTKRVKSAINEAWNDLLGQWEKFRSHVPPPDDRDEDAVFVSDTRTTWLLPLMQTLGWGQLEQAIPDQQLELETTPATGIVADQRFFPVTHEIDRVVPVHLLGAGVPLDRRTRGVPGAADQSPHSMMQELLNASDRHLWAITSNGEQLRILRDTTSLTRQAYVEFDLATMFDNQVFSDFAVLWLVCHRTRFPTPDRTADCWLEQWQDLAQEQGVRALDDLRDGVAAAIEALGTGLLDHAANTNLRERVREGDVDALQLYRQVLRTVYRMMFLLVVEDRDLLHTPDTRDQLRKRYAHHYSLDRLRSQARHHLGGRHGDGWQQWLTLTRRLGTSEGIPQLGVPSLAGGLFGSDTTPLFDGTQMSNRHLYEAVRQLAFVQRESALHRIDFRNLGSEELGSVYESLLELHPEIDLTARTFRLGTVAGNERKTTGSYYTPTSLINVLLNESLDPVVDQTIADAEAAGEDVEEAILSITVCDPAMGSAHFLVGAAFRLAKRLAQIRTTEAEPSPEQVQQALRDVVSRCLYGVDINPMAVELAKVSLWLECHVPGQPTTFLDHHLKHGNSLFGLGFDTSIIDYHRHTQDCAHKRDNGFDGGIPSDAFKPLAGDDKKIAWSMRDSSNAKGEGQAGLFGAAQEEYDFDAALATVANYALRIGFLDDSDPDSLATKQEAHVLYGQRDELARLKLRADAWTATWTIPKTPDVFQSNTTDLPYHVYYDTHYNGMPGPDRNGVRISRDETERRRFFHWFAEFPDIARRGGFDVLLGNPPWGTLATNAVAWFSAQGYDEIAAAPNQSARDRLVDRLARSTDERDRAVVRAWAEEQRRADVESHFLKKSGRYETPPTGTVETSAMFGEIFLRFLSDRGRAGYLCRESVATGKSNVPFLKDVLDQRRLAAFYMFENEDFLFPAVHHDFKFAVAVFCGRDADITHVGITGFIRQAADIDNPERRYDLTADEIAAINPHTTNLPVFRHAKDARVTAAIHKHVPVLCPEGDEDPGPWGFYYSQGLFNMSSDSQHFVTAEQAEQQGFTREGSWFVRSDGTRLRPLHEGKMLWLYDHRYGTYEGQTEAQRRQGVIPQVTDEQHDDPAHNVLHRYWVDGTLAEAQMPDHWQRDWLLGFRDKGTYERTMLIAAMPRIAAGHPLPLVLPEAGTPQQVAFLVAVLASLPCDYAVRQKGLRMYKYVVQQTPVLPPPEPDTLTPWEDGPILDFVVPRVAELSYTSWDMQSFGEDLGYGGPPFRWIPSRRAQMQAELDALMFHLYGLDRDEVEHIVNTFRVLRENEETDVDKGGLGEFRTRRLVLEGFDAMTKAIEGHEPYATPLATAPAAPTQRHSVQDANP